MFYTQSKIKLKQKRCKLLHVFCLIQYVGFIPTCNYYSHDPLLTFQIYSAQILITNSAELLYIFPTQFWFISSRILFQNAFAVTFDQFNVSQLNKSIHSKYSSYWPKTFHQTYKLDTEKVNKRFIFLFSKHFYLVIPCLGQIS